MKWPVSLSLIILLSLSFGTRYAYSQQTPRHISLYNKAQKLFYQENTSDKTDSIALQLYLDVIDTHPGSADSLLWDSYFKAGIYLQTAGQYEKAIPYFKKCINVHNAIPALSDSLLYLPNIYLGNSYYSISALDSAVYYYKTAEQLAARFPSIKGIERLYNTLGVVGYESGDYFQSRYYFEKALQLLDRPTTENLPLWVNYQNNLASSLRELKQYDKALEIYKNMLRFNTNNDELSHNIGAVYLEKRDYTNAIGWLEKVRSNNQIKSNDLGYAYRMSGQLEEAKRHLRYAYQLNSKINGNRKNIPLAKTFKVYGDIFLQEKKIDSAILAYHQSITQLVFDFNEKEVWKNPNRFAGTYSAIELFEVIAAKAQAFYTRYQDSKNLADLQRCINTYESLYQLTSHVAENYESEDARFLLNDRQHLSHSQPIDVCLKLYALTNDRHYIDKAFELDEKNKGAVLALQVQQRTAKLLGGLPMQLTAEEKRLRQSISRLQIQARDQTDSAHLIRYQNEILDLQIRLSSLQKKFDEYPSYRDMRLVEYTAKVPDVQKLVPDDGAILSYHIGDTVLLIFVITSNTFEHHTVPIDKSFTEQLKTFNLLIQKAGENTLAKVNRMSQEIYDRVLSPVENRIAGKSSLMIIPDDELSLIPFQVLQNSSRSMLIREYDITYNYSCTVLNQLSASRKKTNYSILAMAPFTGGQQHLYPPLPGSKQETDQIRGHKLIGQMATKDSFLRLASKYNIIHLATHASANDQDPTASYISFFPLENDSAFRHRLYTSEIMNLSLDNTWLTVLSACETGSGQLMKGEGLMSLTRAFAYAGCANIVASLWRADDVATAKISIAFHQYLRTTGSPAHALQLATIDYLDNEKIPEGMKTPAYFAHLRNVGVFEKKPEKNKSLYWIGALLLVITAATIIYFSRRASAIGKDTSR